MRGELVLGQLASFFPLVFHVLNHGALGLRSGPLLLRHCLLDLDGHPCSGHQIDNRRRATRHENGSVHSSVLSFGTHRFGPRVRTNSSTESISRLITRRLMSILIDRKVGFAFDFGAEQVRPLRFAALKLRS